MTQDEVLSMARAAGFEFNKYGLLVADDDGETDADEMFVRFAALVAAAEFVRFSALVAAAEREACARICDRNNMSAWGFARAIRARGGNAN